VKISTGITVFILRCQVSQGENVMSAENSPPITKRQQHHEEDDVRFQKFTNPLLNEDGDLRGGNQQQRLFSTLAIAEQLEYFGAQLPTRRGDSRGGTTSTGSPFNQSSSFGEKFNQTHLSDLTASMSNANSTPALSSSRIQLNQRSYPRLTKTGRSVVVGSLLGLLCWLLFKVGISFRPYFVLNYG